MIRVRAWTLREMTHGGKTIETEAYGLPAEPRDETWSRHTVHDTAPFNFQSLISFFHSQTGSLLTAC
jgi:hypothetical protein